MAVVTELILVLPWAEDFETMINKVRQFSWDERKLNLVEIDIDRAGGTKGWSTRLYFGAFNHLNLEDLKEYLRKLPWEHPDCVQLMVGEDYNDNIFKLHSIFK